MKMIKLLKHYININKENNIKSYLKFKFKYNFTFLRLKENFKY